MLEKKVYRILLQLSLSWTTYCCNFSFAATNAMWSGVEWWWEEEEWKCENAMPPHPKPISTLQSAFFLFHSHLSSIVLVSERVEILMIKGPPSAPMYTTTSESYKSWRLSVEWVGGRKKGERKMGARIRRTRGKKNEHNLRNLSAPFIPSQSTHEKMEISSPLSHSSADATPQLRHQFFFSPFVCTFVLFP